MKDEILSSGKHSSLWLENLKRKKYPKLEKKISVDVAIVGGGIAGINTAYLLKKQGYSVAIIEKGKIGHGITLCTTAKITYAHGLIYSYLLKKFSFKKAKQYVNANRFAIEKYDEIIKNEKIKCDFELRDFYLFTEKNENYKKLKNEFSALRKLFIPVSFVEKISLPVQIRAAIKYENQAQFHPLKYLTALAEKIPGDDSFIFENTKAVDIKEEKNGFDVVTENGIVFAKYVVVATHFPFYDPAYYFARMYPSRSYALTAQIKNSFPPSMFMNIDENGLTYRNYLEGKKELVIFGGGGHKFGTENEVENYRKLEKNAEKNLFFKKTEFYWSTHDNMSIDKVPYIGRISSKLNNIFVATGFGKWGMTTSMVAAMIISDMIEIGESRWQDIYNPSRFKPTASIKDFMKQSLNVAEKLIIGRMKSGEKKFLGNNEGEIAQVNGKKIATYKDSQGEIHSFKPYCTHMGCLLHWNDAEKSWDCPCHGSRFDVDGKVINSPALKDLEEK